MALLLAACAPAAQPEPDRPLFEPTTPPAISTPVAPGATVDLSQLTPLPTTTAGEPQEAPRPGIPDPAKYLVNQVSQDLAQRLDVDISAIEVFEVEEVEWPDSSLGCPRSGMSYSEVITPGFRIVLGYGGEKYLYHTDRNKLFVLCQDGKPAP
jgi:hypothetical protein